VPLSLCLYVPVSRESLAETLSQPLRTAWDFNDWAAFDVNYSIEDMMTADRTMPRVAATYLESLRANRSDHHGWYCQHDRDTGYLTLILTHWTGSWHAHLMGFNILRQTFAAAGDGDSGYVLAHDFAVGDTPSFGAIMLRHGISKVTGPHSNVTRKIVSHASPVATKVIAQSAIHPDSLVDHYDSLFAPQAVA